MLRHYWSCCVRECYGYGAAVNHCATSAGRDWTFWQVVTAGLRHKMKPMGTSMLNFMASVRSFIQHVNLSIVEFLYLWYLRNHIVFWSTDNALRLGVYQSGFVGTVNRKSVKISGGAPTPGRITGKTQRVRL